jgi:hypothetical protein
VSRKGNRGKGRPAAALRPAGAGQPMRPAAGAAPARPAPRFAAANDIGFEQKVDEISHLVRRYFRVFALLWAALAAFVVWRYAAWVLAVFALMFCALCLWAGFARATLVRQLIAQRLRGGRR